jgi:hypothetical protein
MSLRDEAERQSALLAAIAAPRGGLDGLALREAGERAERGLAAYRANAVALAERALRAAFPTLAAMLGDDDFRQLAREFLRAYPPERGDIGEWGDALPGWIAAHAGLAEWPWLADCARLDLAMHRAERATDAAFDAGSLGLLDDASPAELAFDAMPGTALVASAWPVATIHAAHQAGSAGFDAVREAIAAGRGETVLVAREGWRALPRRVDAAAAAFWRDVLCGATLGSALAHAEPGFDFAAWLGDALRWRALKGVRRCTD